MPFYVYLYLDPRKPNEEYGFEPFYVGKGKGKRDQVHLNTLDKDRTNLHKTNRIKAIIKETGQAPPIIRIADALDESTAYDLEKSVIARLGRVDLGTGCLLNLTDGGDGCRNMSDTGRAILSERMKGDRNPNSGGKQSKGRKRPDIAGEKNFFHGKAASEQERERLTDLRKTEWANHREKYCKRFELVSPDGTVFTVSDGLKAFTARNGLSLSVIRQMLIDPDYRPTKGKSVGWSIKQL